MLFICNIKIVNLIFYKSVWKCNVKSIEPKDIIIHACMPGAESRLNSHYNLQLATNNYYDYEDMILLTIKRYEEDEELLAYYQEKFLYIHIDEYQDTNGSQNEMVP